MDTTGNFSLNAYLTLFNQLLRATLLVTLLFILPTIAAAEAVSGGESTFLVDNNQDEILPPDQAFKLSVIAEDAQTLAASFKVAPSHYLYRDRIKFELKTPSSGRISGVELPKGDLKNDPTFGQTEVYHHDFTATIKLEGAPSPVTLLATYQGCSEKGLCYAPIKKTLTIDLPNSDIAATSTTTSSNDDQATSLLKSGKLWLIIVGFFGFGLLLSLTPCVLPMMPILSGIIVGGKHFGRLHTFNLSLAYTLGMALIYALVGTAAALSGQLISNFLQNPWALGFGAFVFVLLALSMFGFYELQLPSALENRMANLTNRIKGGRFLGVFMMGALSALIVSPCVTAPLAVALLYISKTHDVLQGGVALFALALGMGVPLLLIGASAGTLLPKAGAWMNAVRDFFGVVMLAMAVWLISPVIPTSLQLALWAALLIVPAIYMHALDSLPANVHSWARFWKGVAIIMLVFGITLLIGAASGAKSPLQPLAGLRINANSVSPTNLPFQRIKNLAELENRIRGTAGKTVMLDFYADWCVACKELEQFTFSDPRVQKRLGGIILLRADVTQNSAEDTALLKRFGLFGPPAIVFFGSSGEEIGSARVAGYLDADKFLTKLDKLDL
jgi:thioredoxin:protein disulfide reductase